MAYYSMKFTDKLRVFLEKIFYCFSSVFFLWWNGKSGLGAIRLRIENRPFSLKIWRENQINKFTVFVSSHFFWRITGLGSLATIAGGNWATFLGFLPKSKTWSSVMFSPKKQAYTGFTPIVTLSSLFNFVSTNLTETFVGSKY